MQARPSGSKKGLWFEVSMMSKCEHTCRGFCSDPNPPAPQPGSRCGPDEVHGDSLGDLKDRYLFFNGPVLRTYKHFQLGRSLTFVAHEPSLVEQGGNSKDCFVES